MSWQFTIFGWHVAIWLLTPTPPCPRRIYYCWHAMGEPGLEDYEFVLPLTPTRAFHLAFYRQVRPGLNINKEKP